MKTLSDFKKHLVNKRSQIVFESEDDEAAADYSGELKHIIEMIDCGTPASAIKEYCELVGEFFPLEA